MPEMKKYSRRKSKEGPNDKTDRRSNVIRAYRLAEIKDYLEYEVNS